MASELTVITKSKKLLTYIITITEKSPVKFRYSYVTKLHNISMEIIENLIYANCKTPEDIERRKYQDIVMAKLSVLDCIAETSQIARCITMHQYQEISKEIYDVRNLLLGWMKSDDNRKNKKESAAL